MPGTFHCVVSRLILRALRCTDNRSYPIRPAPGRTPFSWHLPNPTLRSGRQRVTTRTAAGEPDRQDPGRSTVSYRPPAPKDSVFFELGRHSRCSSTRPKPACWQSVANARPCGREITLLCLGQRRGLPHSTCHPCDGSSAESPHGDCLLRRCTFNTTTDENGSDKSKPVRRSIQFDFAVGSYDSHHGCQRQRTSHLAVRQQLGSASARRRPHLAVR